MKNELSELQQQNESIVDLSSYSFKQTQETLHEQIWTRLAQITVLQALEKWLSSLGKNTRVNYSAAFNQLSSRGLVDLDLSLQTFSITNHEAIIDEIKLIKEWSEATRQARAAAYISFTGFLQRRTQGIVRKAVASKEGSRRTFFKVREKVKTRALDQAQTRTFLREIEKVNRRDALIAKLILQGGKRKTEVLSLLSNQIDFENNQIAFEQSKTRGTAKRTVINYPEHIMKELRDYLNDRVGVVFVTRNKKPIAVTQIDRSFIKAGTAASIPFRVTPHVLRVTLVTRLKELKIQDSDIMKITGHASPSQLLSYDKSDLGNNASLYHHFV